MNAHAAVLAFVVTWEATFSQNAPCPQPEPVRNEYTGEVVGIRSSEATFCFENVTRKRRMTFSTRSQAEAFRQGCLECASPGIPFPSPCCSDWHIVEVK